MIPVYEINQLGFRYNGIDVINIDQYSIAEGETIALVGPNGSGKSTLLNLFTFLLAPNSGEIKFFGETVSNNKRHELRRRIGYVQQHPYLFNLTVAENIELGLKLRGINRQLRRARAHNIIEHLNLGTLAHKRAHELSGGEIQKTALARSLVLEPEVLILDEPFTYLDKSFASELELLLLTIKENRTQTVIFSSHDHMRAQLISDHVFSIINGRLTEESSLNLFHGKYAREQSIFNTGKIRIKLPETFGNADTIAIEPSQIVLSRDEIDSSMRNRFRGEVIALHARHDHIEVTIQAGEKFHVVITREALDDLGITVGNSVWASFKSSAVKVLN